MPAIGLLSCLQEKKIKVLEEMEIIGFGDKAIADLCMPLLSYIKRPIARMASGCADEILKWAEKEERFKPAQIKLKEEMVFQGTTREQMKS